VWNCFLQCGGDDDNAFLCSYAHVKILIEERLNQFVIFSGNVQRDTFILVRVLAVKIRFFAILNCNLTMLNSPLKVRLIACEASLIVPSDCVVDRFCCVTRKTKQVGC